MGASARGLTSSVGQKLLAGGTGVLLVLFVLGHLLGNLQVFLGPDALNAYAAKLQGLGGFLWLVRGGLLAVFALHVAVGVLLWWRGRVARPVPYARIDPVRSTLASRTMVWSGALVFLFLGYHLLHFTIHATNPAHAGALDATGRPDVYRMVVLGFREPGIAASYVVAMLALGFHLWHGIASAFQTLGWRDRPRQAFLDRLGLLLAGLVVAGNVAMPVAVLLGLVGHDVTGLGVGGN